MQQPSVRGVGAAGDADGLAEGAIDGLNVGTVGAYDGTVGAADGLVVGTSDGRAVGVVGAAVGWQATSRFVWPLAAPPVPGGHGVSLVAPGDGQYVSGEHSMQASMPVVSFEPPSWPDTDPPQPGSAALLNLPAGQSAHRLHLYL